MKFVVEVESIGTYCENFIFISIEREQLTSLFNVRVPMDCRPVLSMPASNVIEPTDGFPTPEQLTSGAHYENDYMFGS